MAQERTGLTAFKGNGLTLVGTPAEVGKPAADFRIASSLADFISLSDSAGKVRVLNVVPSLDTPVCDTQTRKFNECAGELGDKAVVLTISMDLPPAQARWCGAADAKNIVTLSDYRNHSFGLAYGLHIKELDILARAVLVIDSKGVVRYQEIVPEVTTEPNYDAAFAAIRSLL
ncbi:thiol peroxidase [Candidatus Poribacteria bacterium]|nr:thiol peroxidase [Candidatus Poribacteria bacterium]